MLSKIIRHYIYMNNDRQDEAMEEYLSTGVDPTGGDIEETPHITRRKFQRKPERDIRGTNEALIAGIAFIILAILGLIASFS